MDIPYEQVGPPSTALIVIDMQNDYVHRDGAVIRHFREKHGSQAGADGPTHAERMVPTLQRLITGARAAQVHVIWVVTQQYSWTATPDWKVRVGEGQADPEWGRALYAGLKPAIHDPIVVKHRHSCFFGTDMDLILRCLRIQTLLMTGVGTPYCVESSVRDAFARDFQVMTVSDGTATREWSEHESALQRLNTVFGRVVGTDALLRAWSSVAQPA